MTCHDTAGAVEPTGSVAKTHPDGLHASMTAGELAFFARFGRAREVAAGQVLFERGVVGTQMFIVISGQIDLDFGEDLMLKHLGPGEFFGELGLLIGDHARSAGASASIDSRLIELTHDDFQRLVDQDPSMVAHFLRRSIVRVVNNEQLLIRQLRRRNHDLEAALDNLYVTSHQLNHSEELSRTDELTGLHNRRGLALHLQECRRSGVVPGVGLILIDCDRFKRINDQFGHLAGDRALQNVAHALRSVIADGDLACRLGGDEFCVLVAQGAPELVQHIGECIVRAVEARLCNGLGEQGCSVSVGLCMIDTDAAWNDWYTLADSALYEAKRQGGNMLSMRDAPVPGSAAASGHR
ncbi:MULTISPECIES: GGDEF domain-containing protein [Xanthomonas]|uniref:diguanylate cyclase n=1 Tax=Xanthomonas cucurbitae TaxID=56453 RepID=A0A2S7DT91_9XANT|nr:GGDEF domain-containing protein [Xanthomonas cucurbitae]PPU77058.1 cyclic nucleotide-binding protein [Xanthomonas cucurbitae]QHG85831.1 GGDEF domain-containing protein [Xanthomonas cucurbitae]WDM67415.1 GGDEF domain-containing protein [Xanthomonas cucurbitae]WDM71292.1 GGDEF domain-containing protein [Xanthomonas cucurbitae]WDM75726.1 GGDEF domain-containing protein [Xanthomonas cucurbitae]